jgi:hypothetical protein
MYFSISRSFSSTITISPFRLTTMTWSSFVGTYLMLTSLTTPFVLEKIFDSSAVFTATPPMWNVRIVSCVPGSPIDWAAMMPTALPSSTIRPCERSMP